MLHLPNSAEVSSAMQTSWKNNSKATYRICNFGEGKWRGLWRRKSALKFTGQGPPVQIRLWKHLIQKKNLLVSASDDIGRSNLHTKHGLNDDSIGDENTDLYSLTEILLNNRDIHQIPTERWNFVGHLKSVAEAEQQMKCWASTSREESFS